MGVKRIVSYTADYLCHSHHVLQWTWYELQHQYCCWSQFYC